MKLTLNRLGAGAIVASVLMRVRLAQAQEPKPEPPVISEEELQRIHDREEAAELAQNEAASAAIPFIPFGRRLK